MEYKAFQDQLRGDIENVYRVIDLAEGMTDHPTREDDAAIAQAREFMVKLGTILMISIATPEEVRAHAQATKK